MIRALAVLLLATACHGADVTLAWDTNTDAPDGYRLYWGKLPGKYAWSNDVATATTCRVTNLALGVWYFAATAYAGVLESDFSNEEMWTNKPAAPKMLIISEFQQAKAVYGPWQTVHITTNEVAVTPDATFFRDKLVIQWNPPPEP